MCDVSECPSLEAIRNPATVVLLSACMLKPVSRDQQFVTSVETESPTVSHLQVHYGLKKPHQG